MTPFLISKILDQPYITTNEDGETVETSLSLREWLKDAVDLKGIEGKSATKKKANDQNQLNNQLMTYGVILSFLILVIILYKFFTKK